MKQRLITTLIAVVLALCSWANGTEIDGIYYVLDSDAKTASVTYAGSSYSSGNSYSGSVTIPATITYNDTIYSVTSIGNSAFKGCTGLTSITIPNSITKVDAYSFDDCEGLTKVNISDLASWCRIEFFNYDTNPLYFAKHLYLNGKEITELIIPDSITSIADYAFCNCIELTSITIPNSVTNIGYQAFDGCEGITSITIPNSVTWIGSGAFEGCKGITSIKVEAGNAVYDSRDNCNAIINTANNSLITGCKNTNIPNSVTSIGQAAFSGCTDLTSITIPNSVTWIGGWAFLRCTGLKSITIPNSVTWIQYATFAGCSGLTNFTIPYSVTYIDGYAFQRCTGLTSITIPNSVTNIEAAAFAGCSGLTSITIPNSITSIGNVVFYGCSALTSITIPSSVTNIGAGAFYGCTGLTNITIPNSVTDIGLYAFEGCTGLTDITIPNSVTSIGGSAFRGCSNLASITIPNSVTTIGDEAFSSCNNLKDVYSYSTEPPILGLGVFSGVNNGLSGGFYPMGSALISCPEWTESEEPVRVQIEASTQVRNLYRLVSPFYAMEPDLAEEGYHIEFYYYATTGEFWMDEGMYYIGEKYQGDDVFLYYYPSYYSQYCYLQNAGNVFVITSLWGYGKSLTLPNPITFTWDEGFPGEAATAPRRLFGTNMAEPQTGASNSKNEKVFTPKVFDSSLQQAIRQTRKAQKTQMEAEGTENDYCILHVPAGCKDVYNSSWHWPKDLIVEMGTTSIEKKTSINNSVQVVAYYNLQGQRISKPQRGQLVIARYSDGTSRKVLVK